MKEPAEKEIEKCPFCFQNVDAGIIIELELVYGIYDRFPVNPGHALIIPKRHVRDYFELTVEEQNSCWAMVNRIKQILDEEFCPAAYNVGINNLPHAGQTIPHVHIHLIPRYPGDVENPRGGIRGVIPDKRDYCAEGEST